MSSDYGSVAGELADRGDGVTVPERIQLSRRKGWRMPEGAVSVARPTKWGNPFALRRKVARDSDLFPYLLRTVPGDNPPGWRWSALAPASREVAVEAYGWWFIEQPHLMTTVQEELGGRPLACWCPKPAEGQPDHCHAAWLLEFLEELENPCE